MLRYITSLFRRRIFNRPEPVTFDGWAIIRSLDRVKARIAKRQNKQRSIEELLDL